MRTPLFCIALVAACGDNSSPPDDSPDVVVGRTITGNHLVQYRSLDKALLESEPVDMWNNVIEAQVPEGNGWSIRPGTGHRDGTFTIPDVPEGRYWLRVARRPFGETFYWTGGDHISFDEDVLGPMYPDSADDGDQLLLAVDGLSPWQESDELAYFVPEDIVFDTNLVSWPPPDPDTTDLAGRAVDWTGRSLANVDGDEPAFVVQYRTQNVAEGLDLHMPLRSANPTIAQAAGADATLDTTLTVPDALSYHLAWARDRFEEQRTAIHPSTGPSWSHGWSISALPSVVDGDLWVGIEYPLAYATDPTIFEDTTPLDLGTVAIPNPYPTSWLVDLHVVSFPVDFPLPDGTPQTLEGIIGARRSDVTRTDAVEPTITPIRLPAIADHNGFSPQSGVGVTPVVRWAPPAVGTPTSYNLKVIQAVVDPPAPYFPGWYVAAELVLPGDVTQIRLPADLLVPGNTYGIVVRAFDQPGQDVENRPFYQRATAGFADAILGPFVP